MNLQDILDPIADFIVWTFDHVLVPLGNTPNVLFIILGFVGLGVWMKWQSRYNEKAEREGSLK